MKALLTTRGSYLLGWLLCFTMLGVAVYLEQVKGLAPCPLCQLQRLVFAGLGIVFLTAMLQNPSGIGVKIYGTSIFVLALLGGSVALRQLWLQYTPQVPTANCGVGLGYLLGALPLSDALKLILQGSGDCAIIHWRLFGLTLPGWALLGFIATGFLGIWQNFRLDEL